MPELSAEEIQKLQGTRLKDTPPWLTYADSLEEKLPDDLADAVKKYEETANRVEGSNQNKEELARWKEANDAAAKEYQWLTPAEYADSGPRIGKILHSSELINKLRRECKLQSWYRNHPQPRKVTLMVHSCSVLPPKVGCWVQFGYMPEYSIMNFDEHGIPMAEKYRGWRTCLLQLIVGRHLTEEIAHRAFGKATGPVCTRYNQVLFGIRNTIKL